ncbi:sigma factor-like helix-turn-helix DNA-binding protein [Cytobacillus massiliigabonensis]|nr:sigma factor-like helix-turn-helix DNA-binding protein [Cytobacillus massiliigabonensis]
MERRGVIESPLYKQLLLLRYELELSYKEITEMLDFKVGT